MSSESVSDRTLNVSGFDFLDGKLIHAALGAAAMTLKSIHVPLVQFSHPGVDGFVEYRERVEGRDHLQARSL